MASISEKEFYQLSVSVNKALNPQEAPLKMKHARAIIITTHRTKESKSFWILITRQPLMEHRFTAWKFCHLLHKVLREGHASVLQQSQTHKKMIHEMGKLWGHLQDGVGNCIQAYAELLVVKLDFHSKNAIFPGSLSMQYRDVEKYAGNDINVYFQLCVEVFDYLDYILELETKIFASVNTYRMSSMSPQGQCRLAPLITLIQDSNPLYDLCVRFMFKLHNELPSDVLGGHRDRFRQQFLKLKHFYDSVRPLQYFADLIQVPLLPDAAPNFTSMVDLGSYVPPVVLVQQEEVEPIVDNLVDMTMNSSEQDSPVQQPTLAAPSQEVVALEHQLQEKEFMLHDLRGEAVMMKEAYRTLENASKNEVFQLLEQIKVLNNELGNVRAMHTEYRSEKEGLEMRLAQVMSEKTSLEEEKLKTSEEKFNKLKLMYTQIRDEHIKLLRQHGDLTKTTNKEKSEVEHLRVELEELKAQSGQTQVAQEAEKCSMQNEKDNLTAQLQNVTQAKEEIAAENTKLQEEIKELQERQQIEYNNLQTNATGLAAEKVQLASTVAALNTNIDTLKAQLEDKETELQSHMAETAAWRNASNDVKATLEAKLDEVTNSNDQLKAECDQLRSEVQSLQARQQIEVNGLEETSKALVMEKSELAQTVQCLNDTLSELQSQIDSKNATISEHQQQAEELKNSLLLMTQSAEQKSNENESFQRQVEQLDQTTKDQNTRIARLSEEKLKMENDLQDVVQQNATLEARLETLTMEVQRLTTSERENRIKFDSQRIALLQAVFKTIANAATEEAQQTEMQYFQRSIEHCDRTIDLLDGLSAAHANYNNNEDYNFTEALARKAILVGCNFAALHKECRFIYNTVTDIEKGDEIFKQTNELSAQLSQLYQTLQRSGEPNVASVVDSANSMKKHLIEVKRLLEQLYSSTANATDITEVVEKELLEMDRAIEDAAGRFVELLSNARAKDNGIKLEVNEKILDACKRLMGCIRILIQKSKVLQAEIVALGKGNASAKEFYKRNSQWTEGLISASKSVARAANVLVDVADKAVSATEGNHNFEIIVAAQEIAACTAQLVVASRVKAPKESQKLTELTKASREVSQATGAVVATVKDCNQHLEQSQEIDVSKLTASQAKTMEMDIHVRVLELEQGLQMERQRLSAFRRNYYHNSDE